MLSKSQLKSYKNLISYIDPNGLALQEVDSFTNIIQSFNNYKNYFYKLFKWLTPKQLISLWSLFDKFELKDHALSSIKDLSSGQKQRFAIIQAIFRKFDLLLADEPTSNLDINSTKKVFDTFLDLKENNKTVVVAIHDLEAAFNYCDKIYAIKDGQVQQVFYKDNYQKQELEKYFD
ncbi:ATP-binding cassette domain-containing protein [Mycoplasma nasistruthionis]|nr:ATP-binding cassette domain-containing protein [Mycoplasma nasistruthionis]QCZ36700.1 ATP-binding cassette domain-containing protein [Mycoplasma nasistruthionis]